MRSTPQTTGPSCALGSTNGRGLSGLALPSRSRRARWSPYQQYHAHDSGFNDAQVEFYTYGLDDYERQENIQAPQTQVAYSVASASAQETISRTQSTQVEETHPGRKRGAIWRCFEKLGVKSHGPVRCVYCNTRINSGIPRRNMLPHALACSKVPALEKNFQRKAYNLPEQEVKISVGGLTSTLVAEQAPASRPVTQEEFEDLIGRFFFLSALPFLLIESPALALLFERVASHLKLPNRGKLSGIILQRVAEQVRNAMIDRIRLEGAVSIATDYWTNVNGSGVMNFMVTAPEMKSYLWRAFDTGIEKHTASYLTSPLEEDIQDVITRTGGMVTGISTDNAINMTAACKLLETNLPSFGGSCAAHVFNSLTESLLSKVDFVVDVKDKADTITRMVYDHGQLLEQCRALQRSMQPESGNRRAQVTPTRTRCYTQHACLKSVLTNRDILDDLFRAARHKSLRDNFETAEVETIISSEVFWKELEYDLALINPIIEALTELESDQASPSRVYELFRWLVEGYSDGPLRIANTQRPHQIFGEPACRPSPARGHGQGRGQRSYEVRDWKRDQVRAQFKQLTMECWDYCRTNAIGIAFLLDHRMDTKLFINDDEEKSIEEACGYAVRSKMLERLGFSRKEFKADLYAFAAQEALVSRIKRRMLQSNRGIGGRYVPNRTPYIKGYRW